MMLVTQKILCNYRQNITDVLCADKSEQCGFKHQGWVRSQGKPHCSQNGRGLYRDSTREEDVLEEREKPDLGSGVGD